MLKVQANAAYSISDTYPTKILVSYQDEKTTYIEIINSETNEKSKRIDEIRFEDESISSTSYCTYLGNKTNTFKSKSIIDIHSQSLGPYFFLSNTAATSYCVSSKRSTNLRIRNINNPGIEAKVDLKMQARYLKGNHSLTSLIACDG